MRALVTGGTGFIGAYLVRELLDNHYKLKVMSRYPQDSTLSEVEIVEGDLLQPDTLTNAVHDVDMVFHNAAFAADFGARNRFFSVNVTGTRLLLEACRKAGVDHIIHTSSAGVYGFPNHRELITELSPTHPINPYQSSKLKAEQVLLQANKIHISIVRPPLVLGAKSEAAGLLMQRLADRTLPYFGTGNTCISIVHPADVATCLRLVAEKDDQGEVFNVVSFICLVKDLFTSLTSALGVKHSFRCIPYPIAYAASLVAEATGFFLRHDPQLTRFRVKSFGTCRKISARKAKEALGFLPAYDLAATVLDVVSWYKSVTKANSQ